MNDAKLRVYQFQHPLVRSLYTNTFDPQDMVDEGDQTIRQHRSLLQYLLARCQQCFFITNFFMSMI